MLIGRKAGIDDDMIRKPVVIAETAYPGTELIIKVNPNIVLCTKILKSYFIHKLPLINTALFADSPDDRQYHFQIRRFQIFCGIK